MSDFWGARLAPSQPTEPAPLADGNAYRAWQAAKPAGGSGSRMYDLPMLPEQRAQAQPSIYTEAPAKTLDDYKSAPRTSPLARRPARALTPTLRGRTASCGTLTSLDEATQATLAKDRADAEAEVEGKTVSELFETQRTVNDARSASLGGTQQQGYRGVGFGGEQVVEKLGGTATPAPLSGARVPSAVEIAARLRKAEEARMQAPQRVSTAHLKPSGEGLVQIPGAAL